MLKHGTRSVLVVAAATLMACQLVPQSATPVAQLRGTYTFTEYVAAQGTVSGTSIAGEIRFLRDTVLLDTQSGSCRLLPPVEPNDARIMHFDCPTFNLAVDRRDPLHQSMYSMITSVVVNRTVCTVWGVDAKGNPICVQTGIQSVPTSVRRTGYLHYHPKTT